MTYDLHFEQGATFERTLTWKKDGVAQSLAGWQVYAQVRERESVDAPLILDLTEFITVGADQTTMTMRIGGSVLRQLDPRRFRRAHWDLFLVSATDPTSSMLLLQGQATLDPATTVTP